jgi:omega-6 fatty acid desaturase (delta-12 desaturase)
MTIDLRTTKTEQKGMTPGWKETVIKYQRPALGRALWQVANTLLPYAALWYLMYLSLGVSYWLTASLAVLAAGFLVRVFIIFHDCGHGSFLPSQKANHVVGVITGLLTFTPYYHWRWEHGLHHASAGDLDRRGTGDVWTLTVEEYLEAPLWKRFAYRFMRNPAVLLVVAPLFMFLVLHRFPSPKAGRREVNSVYGTTIASLALMAGLSWLFGLTTYLVLQLGVLMVAGSAGVWLFYVQHQFEGVYWQRAQEWDFCAAALQGSSFYKLPRVLQWFSGNIGFHHIHHLSPRIPNYHLERCHRAEPLFQTVRPVTLLGSLKSLTFRLWDEQRHRLVSFRALKNRGKLRFQR